MNYITKAIGILREDGAFGLLKQSVDFAYSTLIAPVLPRTDAKYNGVVVNAARYFDSIIPWRKKDRPYYESGIVTGLEKYVKEGDSIIIVGGGWGVTAVKAAQKAGTTGNVTVYEGSIKEVKHVKRTAKKNGVEDRVEVLHNIVGPLISLRGKSGKAGHTSPEELPNCDVLELDCEGSEIDILESLSIRPRVIIVESHGMNDAPSSRIEKLLEAMSYSVTSKEVAEKEVEEFCAKNDIHTLTAVRE